MVIQRGVPGGRSKVYNIKDIVKLPYFEAVIIIIRGTITFFHKSHHGIHAFAEARQDLKTGRALESIGKTRFRTMIYLGCSVLCEKGLDFYMLGGIYGILILLIVVY